MSKNNGGPAFPKTEGWFDSLDSHNGMSLRDWLAGQALAGLMTQPDVRNSLAEPWQTAVVRDCVKLADAMIARLGKEKK